MKCPYCNEDLKEWEGRFYCANILCPANQEDLPKFIWCDLIDVKKTRRQLRTVKDRCVKKVKTKEREIESYLNGIFVRQSENERLAKQLKQTQDALDIAVDALEEYEDADSYDCDGNWCGCKYSTAHDALKQIRALKQKDKQ